MTKYWKIIVGILFALALALGILQRKNLADFAFGSTTQVTHFTTQSADSLEGYYQKSLELSKQQSQTQTVSFLAVGDINLSRNVAAVIKEKNDADYPFRQPALTDILKSTNFNFANLESPFSANPTVGGHSLIFGAPTSTLQGLLDNNFTMLNLANNHAYDGGLEDLDFTNKILDENKIQHEGTGNNLDAAWTPAIVNAGGMKVCFVGASYASANDGGKTTNNYVARMEDLSRLKSVILNLKSTCDFVVATMHGGIEYTRTPNDLQKTFAHAAIDDGADVVIGAHPHWIQTIEQYCPLQSSSPFQGEVSRSDRDGGVGVNLQSPTTSPASQVLLLKKEESTATCTNPKYIFYSLGNFIFDQGWSQETGEGLTLKITLSKAVTPNPLAQGAATADDLQDQRQPAKLDSIELIPVIITNSQPRPASSDETKKILQKIDINETVLH